MNSVVEPKYDLFISYAHQDLPFVDELVSHLKGHRLNVWFDQGMLRLGDSFSNSVQEALEHSKYFLLVISPSYLKSAWGNFEMGVALSRAISPANGNIIPLVVGDVNRDVLPPLIAQTQPIIIGENISFDKLAEDLTAIIERGEQQGRVIEEGTSYSPSYSA
ncbi:MAG: toll/interleukin-1 receptor domain-containing protein [Blastocatellia bacterium]